MAIRFTVWIRGLFSGFVTIGRYGNWLTNINLLLVLIRQMAAMVRRALAEVRTVSVLLVKVDFCLTSSSRACGLCDCSCPGVIYAGPMTLRETHRMIADSFALVSSATAPKTCTPILEVTSTHC